MGGGGIGRCGGGGLGGVVEEVWGGGWAGMCVLRGDCILCAKSVFESVKYRVVIVEHGRGGNLGRGIDRVFFESWRVRFLDIVGLFAGIMVSKARVSSYIRE